MGIMLKNAPLSKMKGASWPLIFVINIARCPGAMVMGRSALATTHLDSANEAAGKTIVSNEQPRT